MYTHSLKGFFIEIAGTHLKPWFLPLKIQSCHSFCYCFRSKLQQRKRAGVNNREHATEVIFFFFTISCHNAFDRAIVSSTKDCQEDAKDLIIGFW